MSSTPSQLPRKHAASNNSDESISNKTMHLQQQQQLPQPPLSQQHGRKAPASIVDSHRREKDIINACLESRSGSVRKSYSIYYYSNLTKWYHDYHRVNPILMLILIYISTFT